MRKHCWWRRSDLAAKGAGSMPRTVQQLAREERESLRRELDAKAAHDELDARHLASLQEEFERYKTKAKAALAASANTSLEMEAKEEECTRLNLALKAAE